MNNPFGDLTDDPRHAAAVRAVLEQFSAGGAGLEFKDLADDVLQGRSSLREAVLSRGHESAFESRMGPFADWYRGLSDQEREQAAAQAEAQLDQFLAGAEAEPKPRRAVEEAGDEEPPATYLRDAW